MTRQEFIRDLISKGLSSEEISIRVSYFEETQREKIRDEKVLAERAIKSAQYYAEKEALGGECKTCGCKLSVKNTSGYCQKHVAKAILTVAPEKRAPKPKYVTKTYYGVKGNDLMDHSYYQGGSVSPR